MLNGGLVYSRNAMSSFLFHIKLHKQSELRQTGMFRCITPFTDKACVRYVYRNIYAGILHCSK